MRPFLFFVTGLGALVAGATQGADTVKAAGAGHEQRFKSGETRVSLVELYTSEGCSSCPPAERWLAALRDAPGLWRDFVPLALHVNYWDRLGWPDRFATREFTERQQAYAAQWRSDSVYTPCFVRNGAEWREGSRTLKASQEKAGQLSVAINAATGSGQAEFSSVGSPVPASAAYELHVALLGGDLSSKVTAGENRGETLRHEFVVLALDAFPLRATPEGALKTDFALPHSTINDGARRALAVWVTRRGDQVALQATGGWLEP